LRKNPAFWLFCSGKIKIEHQEKKEVKKINFFLNR